MKNLLSTEFVAQLTVELKTYLALCEEVFALTARENQALTGQGDYQPAEFYQKRKVLLPNLESVSIKLRNCRMIWQQAPLSKREQCHEVKPLFQSVQGLLMKMLLLDRENQQALLRRGLVPVKHLPNVATQPPHYVANLYRRNSVA